MNNYVLLCACLLLGILLRHSGRLPDNAASAINGFVIHISLPAVTLYYVHGLTLDMRLLLPALMAWILFACNFSILWLVARWMKLSRSTTGGLILTGSLGNTSFIGLPMIETFYGSSGLGVGILIDQLGSYFVLSTLGILVATIYASKNNPSPRVIAKKIFTFVPFLAFLLALLLIPVSYPAWLDNLLLKLGTTLVPLALVSVGYQLRLSQVRGKFTILTAGLAIKLIVGPACILLLYAGIFGASGTILQITIFEAAMAPMIGASIVAIEHDLDAPLVSLMVGIGIPLSFLTLPVWSMFLQGF